MELSAEEPVRAIFENVLEDALVSLDDDVSYLSATHGYYFTGVM
jgi:hypothetical protein